VRILRLLKILRVALRFGLDEFLLGHERVRALRAMVSALLFWRDLSAPRAVRLRLALETLGPIFVKFGQVLSTRRDLIPPDIAEELARLQDRVPPFPGADVERILAAAYDKPLSQVFSRFDLTPIASASVAQVHIGALPDGKEVAIKVLRPGIAGIITKDVALLDAGAVLLEWLWLDGKRLKPREVVAEFARHLEDELDLMREAANASQLRRNFRNSPLLAVPEIHWQYCSPKSWSWSACTAFRSPPLPTCAHRASTFRSLRVPALKSFSPKCSATAFSMPICTPAIFSSPATVSMSRSISASWVR
jgi:ubiquinone biosynthesis protein